jgi:hypothetical protein
LYKGLLIADGAVQDLGALLFVAGLFTPSTHTVVVTGKADKPPKPKVHIVPASFGQAAYGVAAFGSF